MKQEIRQITASSIELHTVKHKSVRSYTYVVTGQLRAVIQQKMGDTGGICIWKQPVSLCEEVTHVFTLGIKCWEECFDLTNLKQKLYGRRNIYNQILKIF